MNLLKIVLMSGVLSLGFATFAANETVGEKVGEAAGDAQKATKKGYRKVKDETCQLIKGKMECAKDKAVSKVKNVGDEIKDKTDTE